MFAVSISLGSTSAYVAVAPVSQSGAAGAAPIRVIANSGGHRNTPVAAALTEQEILFGENAVHTYVRQPQTMVPYLFAYSAAAAASSDAAQSKDESALALASQFESTVQQGARIKYRGHCALEEREVSEGIKRHGFAYEAEESNGDTVEKFASAEELFIQFLNYVKEHSIDGACGLGGGADGATETGKDSSKKGKDQPLFLTLVVPRGAFPSVAVPGASTTHRAGAVEWLTEAVRASQLGDVARDVTVLFSDEAALLAFDSTPSPANQPRPYFLLPPSAMPARQPTTYGADSLRPIDEANVLVVDWGAQALCLSLLRTSGGALVNPKHGVPYMCCTTCCGGGEGDGVVSYYHQSKCLGGDAMDVSLTDKLAANYMVSNRRMFQSLVPNMRPLQDLISTNSSASSSAAGEARGIVSETIPARAMRKLRLLMGDKKIALNTNPQASSVAVELEAFYEGMDLMDSQSLSRNKFEAAVTSEWQCVEHFESALGAFVQRHREAFAGAGVTHVLLTGGMLQIPSLVQGVRRVLQSVRNPEVRAALFPSSTTDGDLVTVLDASRVGNGVAADELFSVGGCLHSYHTAAVEGAKRSTTARLADLQKKKKRTAAARVLAEALREKQEALAAAWEALTEPGEESDDDAAKDEELSAGLDAAHVETHEHAFVLRRGVYLYVGTDPAADLVASGAPGVLRAPRAALAPLFPKGSLLPARAACPLPEADGTDVVLYLFGNAAAANVTGDAASVHVSPITPTGIRVPAVEGAAGMLVFTARAETGEDGHRTVAISVHQVSTGAEKGRVPDTLHPGNATEIAEVSLP